MTTLLDRPRKAASEKSVVPALPQVNLLPPSVKDKRALARLKRLLAYAVVAVLVVCAGAYFLANQALSSQEDRLADAQDQTIKLTKEQAKYQEAPATLKLVKAMQGAQLIGFATDVTWSKYLAAVAGVLPDDVQLATVEMTVASPMVPASAPVDPLQSPSMGTLKFEAHSPNLIDTSKWVDKLNAVTGFGDAWVSDVTVAGNENEDPYYVVHASVQVTQDALSGRFLPTEGE